MQASQTETPVWHGTTILTVRKGGRVVIGGDGQVSIGQTVIKSNAKKVRKLGKGDVIGGFAGATADAFTLPLDIALTTRVNGEVLQHQRTSDLIFDVPEIVRFISRYLTLTQGDVIYTGTPGNTQRLKPGDEVEVEIEGIGILRNPIA